MSKLVRYTDDGTPIFKHGAYFYFGCGYVPVEVADDE